MSPSPVSSFLMSTEASTSDHHMAHRFKDHAPCDGADCSSDRGVVSGRSTSRVDG